ncbi:MAG: serine hydrolase, partial [Calditrichaceae bacterium]
MKINQVIIVSAVVLIIIVPGFKIHLSYAAQNTDSLNQQLSSLVSELVKNDEEVKNCVLSVMKGDGSYSWSGASGIACQNNQTPMTKDTPVYISSITKLYTAAAIMRLYEKGIISLDDPMSKYLSEELIQGIHVYKGKDYSHEITIKELLSNTSGIADYYSEKPNDGKSLFEMFLEKPERVWTVDETIDRARKDLEPNFPPGTDASYSDTNYQLLGKIIESVTGKPLHIVYEELFFRPLNLKHTRLVGFSEAQLNPSDVPADIFYHDRNITNIRRNGAYWADGGIISTAEEEIIFLKALNEGRI